MRKNRFEPQHPGKRLQAEFLDDYDLTVEEFASAIRVPLERVQRVLAGRTAIDADLALRLAQLFRGSADGWLAWQRSYDLWLAHGQIEGELEAIEPLDPGTRISTRDDEPLDQDTVREITRRMTDARDPRRWAVVNAFSTERVALQEQSVRRMFYEVASGTYRMDILGATLFKRQAVAESVASTLGERAGVLELTVKDLVALRRDRMIDGELRARFLDQAGCGMSRWDATTYLRTREDMAAYLQAAAQEGDSELIAAAIADVLRAVDARSSC